MLLNILKLASQKLSSVLVTKDRGIKQTDHSMIWSSRHFLLRIIDLYFHLTACVAWMNCSSQNGMSMLFIYLLCSFLLDHDDHSIQSPSWKGKWWSLISPDGHLCRCSLQTVESYWTDWLKQVKDLANFWEKIGNYFKFSKAINAWDQ